MRRCRLASARWAGRWRTRPRCWARWWAWTRASGGGHRGPADLPSARDILNSGDETTVLLSDFKVDIATYLAGRHDPRMRTLQDLIEFDDAHAAQEMPFFGQEVFLQSQAVDVNDPATIAAYRAAVATATTSWAAPRRRPRSPATRARRSSSAPASSSER